VFVEAFILRSVVRGVVLRRKCIIIGRRKNGWERNFEKEGSVCGPTKQNMDQDDNHNQTMLQWWGLLFY